MARTRYGQLASCFVALCILASANAGELTITADETITTVSQDDVFVRDGAGPTTVRLESGGRVNDLKVYDSSNVVVDGGEVGDDGVAFNSSTFSLLSGSVSEMNVTDSASFEMFGGEVAHLELWLNAIVHIRGGVVRGGISAAEMATLNVYGTDLSYAGGLLGGTLEDGSALTVSLELSENAQVVLHTVPEPAASMTLLGVLALGMLLTRRYPALIALNTMQMGAFDGTPCDRV